MKRLLKVTWLSLGLWALNSGPAFAQLGSYYQPQINPRPTVSPYLNLMNGGNPAATYFGIIQPQMQNAQSIQALQQQFQGLQDNSFNQLGTSTAMGMGMGMGGIPMNGPTTGHPVMFQNYSFYYPLLNRNGGNGMGNFPTGNGGISTVPSVFSNRR